MDESDEDDLETRIELLEYRYEMVSFFVPLYFAILTLAFVCLVLFVKNSIG